MTSMPPDDTRTAVLLIDDDPLVRETLTNLLDQAGFSVLAADDGETGLRLYDKHEPAVVVTDILMPHKEGIETIMELRRRKPVPAIVAISGGDRTGNVDYLAMAQRLGADHVLQKPFRISQLVEAINGLLG